MSEGSHTGHGVHGVHSHHGPDNDFGEHGGHVIHAIMNRRSVRSYLDVPVSWDKIITCIEAGMMAPSAGNLQIWRFVVVRSLSKRKALAEACLQQYWMEQAPVHIIVFAKLEREEQYYGIRGTRLYSIQDCAMASQNIMLAAGELGLSSCFVSAFEEEAISRIFNLPDNVRAQGVITVGYSDEKPGIPSRYRVETLVGVEKYGTAMNEGGGRVPDPAAAVHTFRYAERANNYVKEAVSDMTRVVKHRLKKKGIKERIKEKLEQSREKKGK